MTRFIRATTLAGAALLAAAGGCAGPAPSRLHLLERRPPGAPVAAADLCPLRPGTWTYDVEDGTPVPGRLDYRREITDRFGAAWVGHDGDLSEFWRLDEEGNVVMPAAISHPDRAISHFSPPLVIAYRDLAPGAPRRHRVAIRVVDRDRPLRQKESGTATRTIEYVDDQLIRTPLGEFLAKRVVVEFVADLRLADARTTSTLYVVEGLGVVAEEREEEIKIFGVIGRPTRRTFLLASLPGEPTSSLSAP